MPLPSSEAVRAGVYQEHGYTPNGLVISRGTSDTRIPLQWDALMRKKLADIISNRWKLETLNQVPSDNHSEYDFDVAQLLAELREASLIDQLQGLNITPAERVTRVRQMTHNSIIPHSSKGASEIIADLLLHSSAEAVAALVEKYILTGFNNSPKGIPESEVHVSQMLGTFWEQVARTLEAKVAILQQRRSDSQLYDTPVYGLEAVREAAE